MARLQVRERPRLSFSSGRGGGSPSPRLRVGGGLRLAGSGGAAEASGTKADLRLVVEYHDARKLKPDPRNTRTHSDEQIESLKRSLIEYGWTNPAILHHRKVTAGHGRQRAFLGLMNGEVPKDMRRQWKENGEKVLGTDGYNIPCIHRDDMTESQRRSYVIADNRLAELAGWDADLLKDELNQLLALDKVDISVTGFDMSFLDIAAAGESGAAKQNAEVMQASDDVDFPEDGGMYGFTELRKDRILDLSRVKAIATWAGRGSETRGAKHWFYNHNSDSQVDLDWTKVLLGFYVDDVRFEAWWSETEKYAEWAKKAKLWGMVGPNYSTYLEWPLALRTYNIYRSRWVTRYMQEAGINVIPDFTAQAEEAEDAARGLKGLGVVSVQAHQSYDYKKYRDAKAEVLKVLVKVAKPETLILYAPADRLRMFPILQRVPNVIVVEPRAKVRQRQVKRKLEKGSES